MGAGDEADEEDVFMKCAELCMCMERLSCERRGLVLFVFSGVFKYFRV